MDEGSPERLGGNSRGHTLDAFWTPTLAAWPEALSFPSPYFACLVVADGTTEITEQLGGWARRALWLGAVFVSAWAQGCEVVDDVVDRDFAALPDHERVPS